jgi:hypothetical protein
MEIHYIKTDEEEVNKQGSKIWTMMNDNSRAKICREHFIIKHGGFFSREGKYWKWTSPAKEKNGYWLKRVDTGEEVFFNTMKEFCQKYDILPVKVCELLNGKRKTYKGWTAVELRPVKDGTGSFTKEKEPEKPKVVTHNGATFQNIITKEVFYIENISDYAKKNGIIASNLYKVATGKAKSYKNLKLYNPLEP